MSAPPPMLWDFAGSDGLAVARAVFGPEASKLATYQSLEVVREGVVCALLRLCEGSFRVGVSAGCVAAFSDALRDEAAGRRAWVRPSGLASLRLDEATALKWLASAAVVKPPHRLAGLLPHRAVPARVAGCAALVWRHPVGGVPLVEIQTSPQDVSAVRQAYTPLG